MRFSTHSILTAQIPRGQPRLGEFLLVWQRVNASDCALKGNLEMQYSTIFPDEGNDGVCERRKRAPQRERERENEREGGRKSDFYHGSILVLRHLPFSVDLRRSLVFEPSLSLPPNGRKLLDNCYLHFYPIEENI